MLKVVRPSKVRPQAVCQGAFPKALGGGSALEGKFPPRLPPKLPPRFPPGGGPGGGGSRTPPTDPGAVGYRGGGGGIERMLFMPPPAGGGDMGGGGGGTANGRVPSLCPFWNMLTRFACMGRRRLEGRPGSYRGRARGGRSGEAARNLCVLFEVCRKGSARFKQTGVQEGQRVYRLERGSRGVSSVLLRFFASRSRLPACLASRVEAGPLELYEV